MLRVLLRLGVHPSEAEDALQEVFLVVHRLLPTYEERGAVRAWLYRICTQVAAHTRRATTGRRAREALACEAGPSPEDPLRAVMQHEALETIHAFFGSIDESRAMVFYLADVEGMAVPEIAHALGLNLNTAYTQLRWARARFERFLEECEVPAAVGGGTPAHRRRERS